MSNPNQTQNRRRYINFENGSHFICSFNLNNPGSAVCIAFRMNSIASGTYLFNSIIGNHNENTAKSISFYKRYSGIGLHISFNVSYISMANDNSTLINIINTYYKFPSLKSDCTILNKWHVISITWSNDKDLSNCWSNHGQLRD